MDEIKLKNAAIAAVTQYLKEEQEMLGSSPIDEKTSSSPVRLNVWGLSGRQAQMQMRNLISMKGFHGWKGK